MDENELDPSTQRRILVVDDEEKLGRFVSMLLQRAGYFVHTCQSVDEARTLIEEERWALVITDIVMPKENGLHLIQWINEQHPELPCVVMTAHSTKLIEQQALQLGAAEVLHKPFSLEKLRKIVDQTADP